MDFFRYLFSKKTRFFSFFQSPLFKTFLLLFFSDFICVLVLFETGKNWRRKVIFFKTGREYKKKSYWTKKKKTILFFCKHYEKKIYSCIFRFKKKISFSRTAFTVILIIISQMNFDFFSRK